MTKLLSSSRPDFCVQILLGTEAAPLVAMLRFPLQNGKPDTVFAAAYDELRTAMQDCLDPLWGYFPQHPDQDFVNRVPLPRCKELDVLLRTHILQRTSTFADLELAFIRLCMRDIRGKEHGGFHVDIDSGSAFVGDAKNDGTRNICKMLMNLHPTEPRELQYLANSLPELSAMGLHYRRDTYAGIPEGKLPAGAEIRSAVVHPREKDALHALLFWADLVPHTGVDHEHGHFAAGYGAYRPAGSRLF